MPGQVQGIRNKRASLRPSPSFAKSGSLRPKRQPTAAAGAKSACKNEKLLNALNDLNEQKEKTTQVLTIQSFIEKSKNNELV